VGWLPIVAMMHDHYQETEALNQMMGLPGAMADYLTVHTSRDFTLC